MSGIFGFMSTNGISGSDVVLEKMLRAIQPAVPSVEYHWSAEDNRGGLGVVHPRNVGFPQHWATDPAQGVTCVFDGLVHVDSAPEWGSDGARVLLNGYLESGAECLHRISGSFGVAWWDTKHSRLTVANDKIGQRLIFFAQKNGLLLFSSLLVGVVAADVFAPQVDARGLADLLYYGKTLGMRTLFEDIHILGPGSVLTCEAGQVRMRRYWRLDQVEQHGIYDEQRLDELEVLFERAVRRCLRPDLKCSVALTGGLDSRLILASTVNQRFPVWAHTGGQPDSTDVVLARRVAARARIRHLFERFEPSHLAEWLVPMVYRQGGIIAAMPGYVCGDITRPREYDIAINGAAAEPVRVVWLYDPQFSETRDPVNSRRLLQTRMMTTSFARYEHMAEVWQPPYREIGAHAADRHLQAVWAELEPRDPPVLLWEYILLQEHVRKTLNKGFLIASASRAVHLPYLDGEWVEAVMTIPVTERASRQIQVDLMRRIYPRLLSITATTYGMMPLRASRLRRRITDIVRRRITGRPRIIPNNDYTKWSRNEMRPFLQRLLYDQQAAHRAYLVWDRVKPLLDAHFTGQDDWLSVVTALAVFEVAHRLWVERREITVPVENGGLQAGRFVASMQTER